ncbi:MAG: glycosyltransferase family 4 protein [Oscillospiraceae bacterium]|nr:glycosyltransferase family 4 protein [Oscillospiraceae bacterium]
MKKKKVLFVATVVKTHMMQFHIPYLKMFQEMGWETAVASRNDYENPEDCHIPYCDTYYDIPFERTPWRMQNYRAYRMLKQIIEEGNFDIVHCHTPVGAMVARLAAAGARKKGTRVIYTAHGFHFFEGAPLMNWLLFYPAEKILAPLTDVLITINQEDYRRAQKKIRTKRIEYVPGVGIDTHKFRCPGVNPEDKRRELGYTEADFLILTVAEMTPNKNHITVLKALELLKEKEEFRNIHYLICGRGIMRESLENSARELGIADHVNFLGYRTDAPQLYRCSDMFAFVSFREGLSVALMEAMSCGLPIMCTKIRGNTDLIDDNLSGIFTQNDPQSVAESILRLYRDPEFRKSLGRQAMEKVQLFDEENVLKQVKDIYLSV